MKRMRYRTKIMFFLVCLIVFLVSVMLVVCLNRTSSILENEYITQAELELKVVYSAFDKLTSTVLQTYVPIIYDPTLKNNMQKEFTTESVAAIRRVINITPVMMEYIDSVAVYNATHNYIVSNSTTLTVNKLSSHTAKIFQNLDANHQNRVWILASEEYFLEDTDKKSCLSFCVPISGANSGIEESEQYLGHLIVNIKLPYVERMITSNIIRDDLDVFIFNKHGSILANSDNTGMKMDDALAEQLLEKYSNNSSGVPEITDEKFLLCRRDGNYDNFFTYMSLMPYRQIEDKLSTMMMSISSVGIVILLLSLPLSYFIFRSIYRPVGTMIQYLGELAESKDFNVRISENRSDEFGLMFREFNKMTEQIRTLVQELYVKNLLVKDSELMALQSQINPHFLYNTLNTISCLAIQQKNIEVARLIANLSDFMRFSLNEGQAMISVEKTLEQISNYLSIQIIRFPNRIAYSCEADDRMLDFELPTLLLQPLIENSITHGMWDDRRIAIELRIAREEDQMRIVVSDNGKGISPERLQEIRETLASDIGAEGSYYALKNIHARIQLTYGAEYGLAISSSPGHGTTCTIVIPYLESKRGRVGIRRYSDR